MPVLQLNRRNVSRLPAVEKLTLFFDEDLKGFGVRAMPSGARTWFIEYRPGSGGRGVAKRRMVIGSVQTLSPEEARKEARRLLAGVKLNRDPAGERDADRKAPTVRDLCAAFLEERVRKTRKASTAQLYAGYIKTHIEPAIGVRKAIALTRADVLKLHRTIGDTHPVTANRVVALLGSVYAHAARANVLPEGFRSPAREIERYREEGRERFLSAEEIARLGDTLRLAETRGLPWKIDPAKKVKHARKPEDRQSLIDPFACAAIRLLLLTGMRLREVLHLKWTDIDLERGIATLATSKVGRRPVLLGAPAMLLLSELPRVGSYVIPGAGRRRSPKEVQGAEAPRADLKKPWSRIAAHAGLAGVRLHDLRHSFASVGAGGGLGLPTIGKLLGHSQVSTTQRYAHLSDDPLRRASDAISSTIAAALAGTAAEVVPLKRHG